MLMTKSSQIKAIVYLQKEVIERLTNKNPLFFGTDIQNIQYNIDIPDDIFT